MPAIRALWANVALHKHKALQHGPTLSATLDACRPVIKIHYNFLQPLVQEAARQPHIEPDLMTNSFRNLCQCGAQFYYQKVKSFLPFTAPLNHLNLLTEICRTLERPSDQIDGKCQNLLLMKDRYCRARVGDTRQVERQRLTQLSKWLFVAPCVLCLGEIINCIIRTPVIHTSFVPATVRLVERNVTHATHRRPCKGQRHCGTNKA